MDISGGHEPRNQRNALSVDPAIGIRFGQLIKGWIKLSPKRKLTIKICALPDCCQEIGMGEKTASYSTEEQRFFFHIPCFALLSDDRGRLNSRRIEMALQDFTAKGFEPEIEIKSGMKAHIEGFEPGFAQKENYLEMIILCLGHYNRSMSRKQIHEVTSVPYTTICWRIWDNLLPQSKDPIFFIDNERGKRGVELVGLIK